MDHIKFPNNKHRTGSALILVVVLTALLAVIGTIFLLSSRIESKSTSGIEENKALESAIDAIIGKISATLTNDVPGVSGQEYYDYPGPNDTWLASIEPYKDGIDYIWPQITDLTGALQNQADDEMKFATRHVKVDPPGTRKVILEYPEIVLNTTGTWLEKGNPDDGDGSIGQRYRGQLADADGDGIADSKWIKLTDVSTGKGKDIYAAIRIIDNGGMINVNTAYGFNPNSTIKNHVDGSTLSNIDLAQLAYSPDTIDELIKVLNNNKTNVDVYSNNYIDNILRRIESPDDPDYQPFDISDDLDLRNRFCVSSKNKGRLKTVWENTLDIRNNTFNSIADSNLNDWKNEVCRDILKTNYDRRHMLTCWNMDRIINPVGGRMVGVNSIDYGDPNSRQELFNAIKNALLIVNIDETAAQIMVNLVDYIDADSKMTAFSFNPNDPAQYVFGFEGPCVYISEIAVKRESTPSDPNNPQYSYAIELYNPYADVNTIIDAAEWSLQINGGAVDIPITWAAGPGKFHVMYKEDPNAPIASLIDAGATQQNSNSIHFSQGNMISLVRKVDNGTGGPIPPKVVDSIIVPVDLVNPSSSQIYTIKRDINTHYCIKSLWSFTPLQEESLGEDNIYNDPNQADPIQAHPANKKLDCIGDIGNIFAVDVYGANKASMKEHTVRINLANPIYQNLFQYLTVFDPNNDNVDNDGDGAEDDADADGPEWKIPGRININTAPWFVLAQLPWVSKEKGGAINYELSKAIVAYRDKIKIDNVNYTNTNIDPNNPNGRKESIKDDLDQGIDANDIREDVGFASIGELNFVVDNPTPADNLYSMWRYGLDLTDLDGYPDLTKIGVNGDGATNDFEERDIIFARISNLVTVRSDVFTAYILVRVGVDGPQQRAIAVFDRSDVYPNSGGGSTGKVKIRAFQMVSDIR